MTAGRGVAANSLAAALLVAVVASVPAAERPAEPTGKSAVRPICISGVYPHLAVFNSLVKDDGSTYGSGGECGIGAVVPWAGKLWMITYSPHCPTGSTDKLFAIDEQLNLEIRPESIGGTPAGRMIHRESQQLFIGPYAIDKSGRVRVISYRDMPGRHTAISRHLADPAGRVYYFDMEGRIYDLDVQTLKPTLLFAKPVPGWHGKGAYTGQGRYIVANNGEGAVGGHSLKELQVGGPAQGPEDNGVLAEWDGKEWRIIERRQFTDVTGPGGIHGAPDDAAPVWAIGWDRCSVLLKLLDGGKWYTFRLPKASHTYDGVGGWYTEWPRIREIAPGKLLMDMHAMFWDFPKTFSAARTGGLRPIATHHRYIPDFCDWNGRVVLASDDTSIMGNPMAGQSQSNLWFGQVDELATWGPRTAWGGPWVNDPVKAAEPSVPFLINGFERRCLHLAVGRGRRGGTESDADSATAIHRCTGSFPIVDLPDALLELARVTIARGDYHQPAPGYAFTVNQDVVVYLAVDRRPQAKLGEGWEQTDMTLTWRDFTDHVYRKAFPRGRVEIPGHPLAHKPGDYGVPHLCFVRPATSDAGKLEITDLPAHLNGRAAQPNGRARRGTPTTPERPTGGAATAVRTSGTAGNVVFTLEIDIRGDGRWTEYQKIAVPAGGYVYHLFPPDFTANWIRVTADKDCVATAFFHYSGRGHDPQDGETLFAAVAGVNDATPTAGLIRPGKHNRNLQYVAQRVGAGGKITEAYYEVNEKMAFARPAEDRGDEVRKIAAVSLDFAVDEASVMITERGRRFRLPKGDARYDRPFAAGWPRGIRECESERYLMNIHGTFYEKPREGGMWKVKPVASHNRQVIDFCTWRGLLVISGTSAGAKPDGQYFHGADGAGLWFGAVDDVWKFGKPVGRGGPWRDTTVTPGAPSDPYLMTGYDRKRVALCHDAAGEVAVTLEVNIDHTDWRVYQTFRVPAGQTVTHEFPAGYCAHWVRVTADKVCRATAAFTYE